MSAKLLETQAKGAPRVIFIAGADKGWDSYLLTPAETTLMYADTLANGANPWYGIYYAQHDRPGALAAGDMNRFIQENREFLNRTESIANVALVWSRPTADYYRASVPVTDFTPEGTASPSPLAGDHFAAFRGWFDALIRGHFLFDVIDDFALCEEKILARYEVVILPNCACLSDAEVAAIRKYVDTGGTLIATFETGRYDKWGDPWPDFPLKEIVGVDTEWKTFGPLNLDYLSITAESQMLEGLSAKLIPAPRFGLEVTPTRGEVLAYYHQKMPARYHDLPPVSKNPAAVLSEFGKGRAILFAGTFDEQYAEFHNPDHERLLQGAVSAFSTRLVHLENAPSSVEVTLRRQVETRRLIAHLVNFTGEMVRPVRQIVPLFDVRISLAPSLTAASSAKLLRLKESRPLGEENGRKVLLVPRLEAHEVVVFE